MPGERGNSRTLAAARRNAESWAPDSSSATASRAASSPASSIVNSTADGSAASSSADTSACSSSSLNALSISAIVAFYCGGQIQKRQNAPLAAGIDKPSQICLDLAQPLVHFAAGVVEIAQ